MNRKSEELKYRIIEKDVFYVQMKHRFLKWQYEYDIDMDNMGGAISMFGFFGLIPFLCIIHYYNIFYALPQLFLISLKIIFNKKLKFNTLQEAENYIQKCIDYSLKENEKNEKIKNKKIHYVNKTAERIAKLKTLNNE